MNTIVFERFKMQLNFLLFAFDNLTTKYKPLNEYTLNHLKLVLKIAKPISKYYYTFRADYSQQITSVVGSSKNRRYG